jgi:NAD(P)-dependent dehydrogenase (short-subunit alcohol dehydrogenase family)
MPSKPSRNTSTNRKSNQEKGSAKKSAKGSVHEMSKRSVEGRLAQPEPPYPKQKQPRPGLEADIYPRPVYKGHAYKPAGKLEDKVALITGGDSGIGRSVAVLFAREGANVAIVYLPAEQPDAEETREAVQEAGRECLLIPGNVTQPEFCLETVDRTVEELGKLDILVNNAAYQEHQESIEDISDEQFDRTFKTNIYGYFRMAKAAIPHLQPGSVIINTGSITGLEGNKQLLDYASTKGAIHAFTKSLAQQLVEKGIRVNCISPGPVWTPLNVADKEPDEVAEHGKSTPMKRPAQPEEVAPAYVFFASEADSSYITGEVITLLGGETTAA